LVAYERATSLAVIVMIEKLMIEKVMMNMVCFL